MNIKKIIGTFMAAVGLGVAVAAPSMAQQATFASATGGGTIAQQSQVFTYTGGAGGQFTTSAGSVFTGLSGGSVDPGSTLTFLGFTASAPATTMGTSFQQALGSGSFTLKSSTNVLLLSGSFGSGNILGGTTGSTTASITNTVNNVMYNGGTYFGASGLNNPGSFSISMTSVAPAPTIGADGYLTGFKAGGTSTFSASTPSITKTPEPASIIPFALGGLGLLGLIARKNRRTSGMAA